MAACVTGLFPAVAGERSGARLCGRCGGRCLAPLCPGPVREGLCGPSAEQRGDGLGEEVCFLQFVFNGTDGGIPVVGRKMCSRFQQVILKDYLKSLLLPPLIEERFCGPFGDGHSPFGHIGLGRQCSGELRGSLSVPQIPPVTQI